MAHHGSDLWDRNRVSPVSPRPEPLSLPRVDPSCRRFPRHRRHGDCHEPDRDPGWLSRDVCAGRLPLRCQGSAERAPGAGRQAGELGRTGSAAFGTGRPALLHVAARETSLRRRPQCGKPSVAGCGRRSGRPRLLGQVVGDLCAGNAWALRGVPGGHLSVARRPPVSRARRPACRRLVGLRSHGSHGPFDVCCVMVWLVRSPRRPRARTLGHWWLRRRAGGPVAVPQGDVGIP